MKSKLLIALLLLPFGSLMSQDITAKEVIQKADEVFKGVKSTQAQMTVTTVRPKWSRDMTIKTWSLGDDLSLMLVTAPAKDKGTAFLMDDKEVWNWVPAIDRVIKMPPSMMMQSWMGTDLTNDDLVKQSSIVVDYDHTFLAEEEVDGRTCYQIQLMPKEDAAVVWGKILTWVDKDNFFQLRVEFYDEDEDLVNVMTSSDVKQVGNRTLPTRMEVIPVDKKGQKTILVYDEIAFDVGLTKDFFTQQNMKRVK